MRRDAAADAEQERVEEREPEESAFERDDPESRARHERPERAEVRVLAQVRRVEHGLPSRLRKYQAQRFLKTVVTYARPPGRRTRRISAR